MEINWFIVVSSISNYSLIVWYRVKDLTRAIFVQWKKKTDLYQINFFIITIRWWHNWDCLGKRRRWRKREESQRDTLGGFVIR